MVFATYCKTNAITKLLIFFYFFWKFNTSKLDNRIRICQTCDSFETYGYTVSKLNMSGLNQPGPPRHNMDKNDTKLPCFD